MKKIDLEAHFTTNEVIQALYKRKHYPRYADDPGTKNRRLWYTADTGEPIGDPLLNKLLDLGEYRLKNMDAAGVDVQCLSLTTPGVERLDAPTGAALAKSSNDLLAKAVRKHPDRFI